MEGRTKVYVAGSWPNRKYILEEFMNPLEENGYKVTRKWPLFENGIRTIEDQRMNAEDDISAVLEADVLIAVMNVQQDPANAYRGTFCEIGAALARNKPVLVYCPLPILKDGVEFGSSDTFQKTHGKHWQTYDVEVGLPTNVFLWHRNIRIFQDKEELLIELQKYVSI